MLPTALPFPLFSDVDGRPLNGGSIYFGVENLNPETNPIVVYWDAAGTQPASQPISTLNGYIVRSGTPARVYANSAYSITVRNTRGEQVYTAPSSSAFDPSSALLASLDAYVLASAGKVVNSFAALRALSKLVNTYAFVTGSATIGDGGGGAFRYDSTDTTSTDNGVSTIVASDGGRWKLYQGIPRVKGVSTIAMGLNSATAETTGYENIAIGQDTLTNNTTAFGNLAMGRYALQNANIKVTNITGCANNGSGLIRVTAPSHGFSWTNYAVEVIISGVLGCTEANGSWTATVINANTFDLQSSAFVHAYTSGGTVKGQTYVAGWNVALGNYSLRALTTGWQNTACGVSALANNTYGNFNTGLGYGALQSNISGYENTAVGTICMVSGDNSGLFRNVAVGFASLGALGQFALVAGANSYQNVAVGHNSGSGVRNGTDNVLLGSSSGLGMLSGSRNTFLGANTLYAASAAVNTDDNTMVGYNCGTGLTSGSGNTFIGCSVAPPAAACSNTLIIGAGSSGAKKIMVVSSNTAMGLDACFPNLTSGVDNTMIGHQAGGPLNSGSNNTGIGAYSLFSVTTGSNNSGMNGGGFSISSGSNNLMLGRDAGYTTSPSGNITTQNNVICLGDNNIATAYIKVAWTVTSDKRDKTDVQDFGYGLSFVNALRPVKFRWDDRTKYWEEVEERDGEEIKRKHIKHKQDGSKADEKFTVGFLSQDVIAAEKKHGATDGNLLIADDSNPDLLRITESKMLPALVKAVQELSLLVQEQAKQIAALQQK
jgi:hypothetical protein